MGLCGRVCSTHRSHLFPAAAPPPSPLYIPFYIRWACLWSDVCARPTSLTWKMQFMWKHAWRLAPLCSPLAANSVESAKLNQWFFQLQSIDHRSRTRCRLHKVRQINACRPTLWFNNSWMHEKNMVHFDKWCNMQLTYIGILSHFRPDMRITKYSIL